MNRTMCPGQDTRYWRPGDIFNVRCASCGSDVEFFKDDAKRRCGKCGAVVSNPRLSTGCAQWCEHARECLGYDPATMSADSEAAGSSIAGTIMDALEKEFGKESDIVREAADASRRADALLESSPANPGVVIPAVLLLDADKPAAPSPGEADPGALLRLPVTVRILESAGAYRNVIDEICGIISAYRAGTPLDSEEYRLVSRSRGPIGPGA